VHQVTFIAWFAVMTVHVLGHIVETVRVAPRDWSSRSDRTRGTRLRRALMVVALISGLVLGLLIQSTVGDWLTTTS
jgi:hypothetical protein